MMKELHGELSISRISNRDEVVITLSDSSSGCRTVKVAMNLHDFALALTGMGNVECSYLLTPRYAGMERQMKTVQIFIDRRAITNDEKPSILQPYEIDGWIGSRSDLGNSHCYSQDHYNVKFTRYVNLDTGEVVP